MPEYSALLTAVHSVLFRFTCWFSHRIWMGGTVQSSSGSPAHSPIYRRYHEHNDNEQSLHAFVSKKRCFRGFDLLTSM